MKKYKHITDEEKEFIRTSLYWKKSIRQIAISLGRNVSSISREIRKNTNSLGYYIPDTKYKKKWRCKRFTRRKRKTDIPVIKEYIVRNIKKKYSPQIIAARMFKDTGYYVNKDTIYEFIYRTEPELTKYLPRRHKGKIRMRFFKNKNRSIIQNRTDIDYRPQKANERCEVGHFEADTIMSAKNSKSALLVIVDRQTRMTRIKKLARKTSEQAKSAIIFALKSFNIINLNTITYDNGSEFSLHQKINEELKVRSYFCKPYHSWEKGTVENINGLIRWFFPKGTDFDTICEEEIQNVEDWINNRPMRVLNYLSPYEYYKKLTCVAL